MIIDFHTHYFPEKIAASTVAKLAQAACCTPYTDGSLPGLLTSMKESGITYSVTLPVVTNPVKTTKMNDGVIEMHDNGAFEKGLITFGGIHPDSENIREELTRLKEHGIKGIKIHPAYQNCDFDDIRMKRIISCAEELGLITITHAGLDIGILDRNYASVAHILNVLQDVQPTKLVLAHLGGWAGWDEVESDLAGAPVYLDTAFTYGEIVPYQGMDPAPTCSYTLSEEQLVRIVRKHGSEKVLFATDSPWQDQRTYPGMLKAMAFTENEKQQILYDNAAKLLEL